MFTLAVQPLQDIAVRQRHARQKIDRAIAALAGFLEAHAFFPAIMLREVAEGGAHLDRDTLTALAAVPRTVGGIVQQGIAAGVFRPVHPIFAYFSMLAPMVFFLAGAPIRKELSHLQVIDMTALSPAEFVSQLREATRRSLVRNAGGSAAS